jgi:DNA invertase Pin-like site-specific DNA recombinase
MKYFYARVSTKHQNLARQIDAAESVPGVDKMFCDKQSGKTFDRAQYTAMKSILVKGDEVVVKSLDRLGRNKADMKKELDWFKENGIVIRVMDLPTTMIEMPVGQEWVIDMVNNILIEVLGAIAEQERLTTERRRQEGIAAMPVVDGKKISSKTGRGFGRPKKEVDMELFLDLVQKQRNGCVTANECCDRLGVSRSMWYSMVRKNAPSAGTDGANAKCNHQPKGIA